MQGSRFFQRLKLKLQALTDSKRILVWIVLLSFFESTIIPVPLEAILIPLMYSCRDKIWSFALAALLGCLIGAGAGYAVGAFLFDSWSAEIVALLDSKAQLQEITNSIEQDGFKYVLAVGITPVPFQLAMIAAGAIHYSFVMFLIATLIARGIRYFGLAALVYWFGPAASDIIKRYKFQVASILSLAFVFLVVTQLL